MMTRPALDFGGGDGVVEVRGLPGGDDSGGGVSGGGDAAPVGARADATTRIRRPSSSTSSTISLIFFSESSRPGGIITPEIEWMTPSSLARVLYCFKGISPTKKDSEFSVRVSFDPSIVVTSPFHLNAEILLGTKWNRTTFRRTSILAGSFKKARRAGEVLYIRLSSVGANTVMSGLEVTSLGRLASSTRFANPVWDERASLSKIVLLLAAADPARAKSITRTRGAIGDYYVISGICNL